MDGRGERWRDVRLVSYPLMIKILSQSCRQPDQAFLTSSSEAGRDAEVLVVVENTKRANLREILTNTSGLYVV